MNRQVSPNIAALVLVALAVLCVAILPVSIQIVPQVADAQETPAPVDGYAAPAAETQLVAQEAQVVEYTLRTVLGQTPPMAFIGVGGDIDGQINPTLTANVGDTVRVTVINGDPVMHDFVIDEFNVTTGELTTADQTVTVEFVASLPGEYVYYCSVPGHREIGMFGLLQIAGTVEVGDRTELAASQGDTQLASDVQPVVLPAAQDAVSIVRDPSDVPPPVGDREPMNLRVDMTTLEVSGVLADGTPFPYFTFDGTVPGPMLRLRVGDTVDFYLKNADDSLFLHSIDLHAVTGPGGGAVYTPPTPGGETYFRFQAINPGIYVYHCATASIPHHISSGMYGLVLVEPEGGLPPVDREFYVMQGDIYTNHAFGTQGHHEFNMAAMLDENANYLVFNGAVGGLTSDEHALRANVGETVRIFFGVGGPNYTSSFHVIGEIFDRVYSEGSITSPPLTDVQTTLVPAGGATIVEFTVDVPGRYILVDHSLSRLDKGLAGYLYVEGEEQPDIYYGGEGAVDASGH